MAKVTVITKDLIEALKAASISKCKFSTSYVLQGVLMKAGPYALTLVSTDGNILQSINVGYAEESRGEEKEESCILADVDTLIKKLDADSNTVDISIEDSEVVFSGVNSKYVSKTLEGKYPEYEQFVPKAHCEDILIDLDINLLERVVKSAKAIKRSKTVDEERVISFSFKLGDTTRVLSPINYSIRGIEGLVMPVKIKNKVGTPIKPLEVVLEPVSSKSKKEGK